MDAFVIVDKVVNQRIHNVHVLLKSISHGTFSDLSLRCQWSRRKGFFLVLK